MNRQQGGALVEYSILLIPIAIGLIAALLYIGAWLLERYQLINTGW